MLTNLDAARRSAKKKNEEFDENKYVFNFFDIYSKNKEKLNEEIKNVCSLTIKAYKEKIMCRNRNLNSFLGCFHILAYDFMMSANNELKLLEINTSPGWKGPRNVWGHNKLVDFFDDIFKLTIDKKINAYKTNRTDTDLKIFKQIYPTYSSTGGSANTYETKYIKYKNKYLKLKNKLNK
jgi:hypothetical protein